MRKIIPIKRYKCFLLPIIHFHLSLWMVVLNGLSLKPFPNHDIETQATLNPSKELLGDIASELKNLRLSNR